MNVSELRAAAPRAEQVKILNDSLVANINEGNPTGLHGILKEMGIPDNNGAYTIRMPHSEISPLQVLVNERFQDVALPEEKIRLAQTLRFTSSDPNVTYTPMWRAYATVVRPGEKKTNYTDNLVTCTAIATTSRVVGHPDFPDNTVIAIMSHDMPIMSEQQQIDAVNKLITEYKLKEYGDKHAVIISLSERPDDIAAEHTQNIFRQINATLGESAALIPHQHPPFEGKGPEDRGLILDVSNLDASQSIEYDLFAKFAGTVDLNLRNRGEYADKAHEDITDKNLLRLKDSKVDVSKLSIIGIKDAPKDQGTYLYLNNPSSTAKYWMKLAASDEFRYHLESGRTVESFPKLHDVAKAMSGHKPPKRGR